MAAARRTRSSAGSGGFGLVEVMVGLFVLAVGILGIASLQVTSKRTNFEAVQRTTATHLVQDLLERIRTNSENMAVYTADGAGRTIALSEDDAIAATDCAGASCAGASVAMYDLYEFSLGLAGVAESRDAEATGGLVSPTVCITGPAARPGYVSIALAWRGLAKLSDPTVSDCGAASGRYDGAGGDADVFRRVLLVSTYVQ